MDGEHYARGGPLPADSVPSTHPLLFCSGYVIPKRHAATVDTNLLHQLNTSTLDS